MKKNNDIYMLPPQGNSSCSPDISEEDALFSELQALWDEQRERIDRAVAEAGDAIPAPRRRHPAIPFRLRMMWCYAILTLVALAAVVYWAILIPSLAFTSLALVVCLAIELVYVILFAECLYWTVCLIVYNPSRVGVLRMSRFVSRSHPHPHYSSKPSSSVIKLYEPDSFQVVPHARKSVAAGIAAVFSLSVVSCTTTGIDGYSISQKHPDRTAVVEGVVNTLNNIR